MPPRSVFRAIGGHLQQPSATAALPLTSHPAGAEALPLTSHLPAHDPTGADAPGTLSPDEISFFTANGYLIKRKLIPAAVLTPFVVCTHTQSPPRLALEQGRL